MSKMGDRIRELRKQHNMTQEELGKHLGIGRSAVLKYEKDEIENIPRSNIERMASMFGVSPAYLMGFEEWDSERLADEATLTERIQTKWGCEAVELINHFTELNPEGQALAVDVVAGIGMLKKYRK